MKFSPDIGHKLLWFWIAFFKVVLLSFVFGFAFYKIVIEFEKAWKAKRRLKMWICLSIGCFALYVFLFGIK